MVRIVELSPSWRPLDSPRLIAAVIPSRCLPMVRPTVTNSSMRHRDAQEHHRRNRSKTFAGSRSPANTARSASLRAWARASSPPAPRIRARVTAWL